MTIQVQKWIACMSRTGVCKHIGWHVQTWIGHRRSGVTLLLHPWVWIGAVEAMMRLGRPCLRIRLIVRCILRSGAKGLARWLCPHALPGGHLPALQSMASRLSCLHSQAIQEAHTDITLSLDKCGA